MVFLIEVLKKVNVIELPLREEVVERLKALKEEQANREVI
jgi:hypothetical protein